MTYTNVNFDNEFLSNLRENIMKFAELLKQLFKGAIEIVEKRLNAAILWFEERSEFINDFYTPAHPATTWKPMMHQAMKSQVILKKPRRINARSSC